MAVEPTIVLLADSCPESTQNVYAQIDSEIILSLTAVKLSVNLIFQSNTKLFDLKIDANSINHHFFHLVKSVANRNKTPRLKTTSSCGAR